MSVMEKHQMPVMGILQMYVMELPQRPVMGLPLKPRNGKFLVVLMDVDVNKETQRGNLHFVDTGA
jgi:hypothetical protein